MDIESNNLDRPTVYIILRSILYAYFSILQITQISMYLIRELYVTIGEKFKTSSFLLYSNVIMQVCSGQNHPTELCHLACCDLHKLGNLVMGGEVEVLRGLI